MNATRIDTIEQLARAALCAPHEDPQLQARQIAARFGLPVWLHDQCRPRCYASWGDPEYKFPDVSEVRP